MSEDILKQIVKRKKEEVADAEKRVSLSQLKEQASCRTEFRPFFSALNDSKLETNIIAEIKRASPSKGPIGPDLDPGELATAYEEGGACALSVLTDRDFFMGSMDDFKAARKNCSLPMLRKDFIVSEYQVYESAVLGADCILLIARILSPEDLKLYYDLARKLGMDVLVEIYSREELGAANETGARLIGINNRNLASFHTDTEHAATISGLLSEKQLPVAASGISQRSDITRNLKAGIRHFLIGESLVKSADPRGFLKELRTGVK